MQPGYNEVDVPPHLIKLFNEVFEKDFGHCKLYMRAAGETFTDSDLWSVMVDSVNKGIFDADDDDILDDDWTPPKKITWH